MYSIHGATNASHRESLSQTADATRNTVSRVLTHCVLALLHAFFYLFNFFLRPHRAVSTFFRRSFDRNPTFDAFGFARPIRLGWGLPMLERIVAKRLGGCAS